MLPNQHKITSSEEFKQTIRRGKRAGGGTVVVHLRPPATSTSENLQLQHTHMLLTPPPRAGLVVSKAVGNAVTRHSVSRKLRHILMGILPELEDGTTIVLRALAPAATATSKELERDVRTALAKIRRPKA
ncbi:ribonuclease P protein component [Corynebacterium felinum]|uniref:ribonuclease P protein component n=1 Tax=Corynebacterium felinum TaxID=131318 RepID=UPI0023F73017|nr:ribonuclease P protein component [Corynebacterium felinum]MDF5819586.1 ribonuclease P protein component [Corynebacterium felinum]WJY96453.1 ribonuclease P [Corynebacterium felinum]